MMIIEKFPPRGNFLAIIVFADGNKFYSQGFNHSTAAKAPVIDLMA